MNIRYETQEGKLRVWLEGELGHHEAIRLMARLNGLVEDHLPARLELDLSGLEFMDSSGIAVVVQTARECRNLGCTLSVCGVGKQAMRVLSAAGLQKIVPITERERTEV